MSKKAHHELKKYRDKFPWLFENMNALIAYRHETDPTLKQYLKESIIEHRDMGHYPFYDL